MEPTSTFGMTRSSRESSLSAAPFFMLTTDVEVSRVWKSVGDGAKASEMVSSGENMGWAFGREC